MPVGTTDTASSIEPRWIHLISSSVTKMTHSFKGVNHITLQSNSVQLLGVQTPEIFWTFPD